MSFFTFPERVNEYAARTVATVVATSTAVAFGFRWGWIFPILALGFVLRVGWGPKFSPLARFAMFFADRVLGSKPVAGPPKRFAQGIGAICMIAASALWFAHFETAAWAVAGMVVVFATLEATIAFCMGCWIYARLQRAGIFPPDACVDCVPRYLNRAA